MQSDKFPMRLVFFEIFASFLVGLSPARAGLLEGLSEISNTVTGGGICRSYNENQARKSLETTGRWCRECSENPSPAQTPPENIEDLRKISDHVAASEVHTQAEDLFFDRLARQHSRELECSADFAQNISETKTSAEELTLIQKQFQIARAAKQKMLEATQRLSRFSSLRKTCPLSLDDLRATPLPPGVDHSDDETCESLIQARLVYQAALSATPLAGVGPVQELLERYASLPEGAELDQLQNGLLQQIRKAYSESRQKLATEITKLRTISREKGGAGFDRNSRYALLSDPRVTQEVIRQSGGGTDVEALACQADARFGRGADSLDNVVAVGSILVSGGAAISARVGSTAAKTIQGLQRARSIGLISLNTTRVLQISALGLDTSGLLLQVERECGQDSTPMITAQGTENGACVAAPTLQQVRVDHCAFTRAATALGFGLLALDPALKAGKALSKALPLKPPAEPPASALRHELTEVAPANRLSERRQVQPTPLVKPRTPARQKYVDENLNYHATTPAQNQEWIKLAEGAGDDKNVIFFNFENSVMQHLNRMTKDFNLVTAASNRFKKLFFEEVDRIEKKYPQVRIVRYSDPKSSRVAFVFSGKVSPEIEKEVSLMSDKVNKDFAEELTGSNSKSPIFRRSDRPETWHRGGCAKGSEAWADMQARMARKQGASNRLLPCDAPEVRIALTSLLDNLKVQREQLEKAFGKTSLMTGPRGEKRLARDLVALIRKNPDPEILAGKIRRELGYQDITTEDARHLLDYSKGIDEFSPGLYIPERQIVNLEQAENGGIGGDFIGMGSFNQIATEEAVIRSKDVDEVLRRARQGERTVTQTFQKKRNAFIQIIEGLCTGDDCSAAFTRPKTLKEKQELLHKIASNPDLRAIRISTIPKGAPVEARDILSTHGQNIADYVRAELSRNFPKSRLKKMVVGIDMRTTQVYKGKVGAIVGVDKHAPLSKQEENLINQALRRAVERYNDDLRKLYGIPSNYRADTP